MRALKLFFLAMGILVAPARAEDACAYQYPNEMSPSACGCPINAGFGVDWAYTVIDANMTWGEWRRQGECRWLPLKDSDTREQGIFDSRNVRVDIAEIPLVVPPPPPGVDDPSGPSLAVPPTTFPPKGHVPGHFKATLCNQHGQPDANTGHGFPMCVPDMTYFDPVAMKERNRLYKLTVSCASGLDCHWTAGGKECWFTLSDLDPSHACAHKGSDIDPAQKPPFPKCTDFIVRLFSVIPPADPPSPPSECN
jgi:hypothetical protein